MSRKKNKAGHVGHEWRSARDSSREYRKALRIALMDRDLTQADLAREAGVTRTAVTMWAYGINKKSVRIEEALKKLGITIETPRGESLRKAA